MKKTLLLITLTAAMLSTLSCNKYIDSVTPVTSSDKEIVFGTAGVIEASQTTKAISTSTASGVETNGFKVAGVITSATPVTLFNEDANKSGDVYKPSSKAYYYPSTGMMNFYAMYPSKTLAVSGTTVTLADYTCNGTDDLIAAEKKTVSASSSAVALSFNHILSGLTVMAYGTDAAVDYKITKIEIVYNNKGTYTYPDAEDVTSGTVWGLDATAPTAKYESSTATSIATAAASATEIMAEKSVIPGTVKIKLSWETYSKDASATKLATYTDISGTDQTIDIAKKTTITCRLGNSSAEPISFTISVADWGSDSKNVDFDSAS